MSDAIGEVITDVLEKYKLKAKPSVYGGITYRSRIEGRWAVFFDSLRLRHEYEREGYDLGDGVGYLPDFWLPDLDLWLEVKGADPEDDACDKAHRLAVASGKRVMVFFGGMTMPDAKGPPTHAYAFFPDSSADTGYQWCQCPQCAKLGIEFQGRTDRLSCKGCYFCHVGQASTHACKGAGCKRSPHGDKGYRTDSPQLSAAFAAARNARFEP